MGLKTGRALALAGDAHRFQYFVIAFVSLKWFLVSLTVFLPSYLLLSPTFTCGAQLRVPEDEACGRPECVADSLDTLSIRLGLYCENRSIRDALLASEFVGSISGLVLLAVLADLLGRKLIIVATLFLTLLGVLLSVLGGVALWTPAVFAGQVLQGFGGYSLSMVSYSYLSEVNSESLRQLSISMTYAFWALGEVAIFAIVEYVRHWQLILLFVLAAPFVVLLAFSRLLVETPEYLLEQQDRQGCLSSLNAIASFNSRPALEESALGVLRDDDALDPAPSESSSRLALVDPPGQDSEAALLAKPVRRRDFLRAMARKDFLLAVVCLSLSQACNNGYYYTAQFSLDEYGFGFAKNMLFVGLVELAACLLLNFCTLRLPRRKGLFFFLAAGGACGVFVGLAEALNIASWQGWQVTQLVLICLSRFLNTAAFSIFGLLSSETFATAVRSTGLGVTEAMSNVGNILAPFIVSFATAAKFKPVLLGGALNVVGAFFIIPLRETKLPKQVVSREEVPEASLVTQDRAPSEQ